MNTAAARQQDAQFTVSSGTVPKTGAASSLASDPAAPLKAASGTPIADRVKAQLAGDYPPGKLAWVDQVSWRGPQSVPLAQIDRTAGQPDWDAAAANKAKVQTFRKRLAAGGWWKAAVVLRLPGKPRLFVVDGHCRIVAATTLGMPVQAYVGTARTVTGPWSVLHSQQLASDASALEMAVSPGGRPMDTSPFSASTTDNWVARAGGLPNYIRGVAHALLRTGRAKDLSSAVKLAVGAIQHWAEGRTTNGKGHVHPAVQAAAAAALAEWESKRAASHAHANEGGDAMDLATPSLGEIALAFSEALHPRVPAGGAGGGEFGSKAAGPAKTAKNQQQKPGIGAGRKAALAKQAASLHARAKADRMQAAELESQLQTLNAAIKVKVAASAKAKTAAKSAAAKAGTAKKAAKVTKATNKAKAGKKATAKKASLPHMRVRRIVLRSKIHDLRSQARALDKQAAAIKLAGDSDAIELVGPHGYVHGWVKVGGVADSDLKRLEAESPGKHRVLVTALHKAREAADQGFHGVAATHLERARSIATQHLGHHAPQGGLVSELGIASRVEDSRAAMAKARRTSSGFSTGRTVAARKAAAEKVSAADRERVKMRKMGLAEDSDDGRFLELAFAEALAERVPSGRRDGGQFHARTSLTRHDTPEQRARAVNAMDERQRAAVRVSTLPPPGWEWARGDRLTVAK